MNVKELLSRIEEIRADCADRAAPGYSGFIDPSEADLAREEGQRDAYRDIASLLASLLSRTGS